MNLRTDADPLTKRLRLPALTHPVRWVAYSPIKTGGLVPGRTDFFDVYAYLELDQAGWEQLEKTAGANDAPDAILLPKEVVSVLLPSPAPVGFKPSGEGLQATGPSFNADALSTGDPKTKVGQAIRVGNFLLLMMEVD